MYYFVEMVSLGFTRDDITIVSRLPVITDSTIGDFGVFFLLKI